jgi:hypothetical protein
MKNTLLIAVIFSAISLGTNAQNMNLGDFENGVLGSWGSFSAPYSIEANPVIDAVNGSDSVALLDQSGGAWNGFRHWSAPVLSASATAVELDVYMNQAGLIQIYMDNPVASGAATYTKQVTGIAAKTWTRISFNITDLVAYDYQQIAFQYDKADSVYFDNITLVQDFGVLIPGFIARETFGTLVYDTGNPVAQPTGYATGYNWYDVTDFTSENGHIETGNDSSIRVNTYGNAYTVRGPLVDPSAGAHALIVDRAAYNGSWDTLVYMGIDLSNSVATSVEFAFGKAPAWFINNDTNVINVEYRIDGADWIQMDTSLIDTLYKGIWDYAVLPIEDGVGSVMDVRLCGLTTSQVMIDDLGVFGMVQAPQGTNEFSIANVVVGAVDDAADFTCNLTASWDVDSLYLNFVITDDSIVTSGNAYQVDNLEIYLDLDNSKNVHWPRNGGWLASVDAAYDANDFQFRLVPGVDFSVNNGSRPSTTNLSAVKQIYTVTDTGYNFTLNVAWDSLMADFDAVEEALIGFDVLVSDNDATASDANRNQITLNSPTDKPFNDPSLFATFAFKADGRFEIIPDETNPSVPANFAAECVDSVLTITWDNATDNIAVLQYEILQGGQVIATPYALATGNRYVIRDLAPADYNISIRALDNYGNTGPASSSYVNCPPVVSINPSIAEQFNIYPNPASSVLNIAAGGDVLNVQVISITGAVVMNINNQNQIDLSGLNSGLYMIKVATDSNIYSTTFVKE